MSEPVARLEGVTHRYGKRLAVDALNLAIPAGCMAGLIGPDGVGKSTVLALLAGVRKLQTGSVQVLGGNMAEKRFRDEASPRIAYMPQGLGRNLYPTLTVFENLDFFARLFGQGAAERQARIHDLLTATGLDPFPDRPAGKLSGGMKQKLSLCCALIHDPDFLILDEPTTGVDPLSRQQFWDLIDTIRARRPQMSVIVATAYMDEAERFDWLAAMDDGKVIAEGSPAEVRGRAGKETLEEAFIALLPEEKRRGYQSVVVPPRVVAPDEVPAIEAEGLTCRFGNFTAVDNVSFRISKGEIFGFLGSNGCGKSTTMKMLTGLITPTEGWTKLFGQSLTGNEMEIRQHVGYMSQAFSLYTELTVRQNLDLHAHLFHIPANEIDARIEEMLTRYDLSEVADALPDSLPLGMRQRLQLAVAVIHRPSILILDEPTSGVDPVARDSFWRTLISLARDHGVTIFISTHFMNEAARCDRISLMHAGKVFAVGAPQELAEQRGKATLEEAFVSYLKEASGIPEEAPASTEAETVAVATAIPTTSHAAARPRRFDPGRLWAYARRETMELLRDRIRLWFALFGPVILMITFGYGISFDVENLTFAAYDQDKTQESRQLLENFSASRYFSERPDIASSAELQSRLKSGEVNIAIEIPSGYGRDLKANRQPEVSVTVDGSMPFRAETAKGYVTGLATGYASELMRQSGAAVPAISMETRFRYNQAFKSVNAMVPSVIMLMLVLIPAIMSAIGIVREKETGSIANFYSTPISKPEFLLGKQLPYIGVSLVSAAVLFLLALFLFRLPLKGSFSLFAIATLVYLVATTGFGQLVSTFTKSQVAAVVATAIIAIVPAVNFSGLIIPVSSLTGSGRALGLAFPPAWYQPISVGAFTKGLGWLDLWPNLLALVGFCLLFFALSLVLLRKQDT
ncbi:multidrug ABC transporter ATP-binding protein [Kaistia sp. 32K]|uniref:ribosome-associated ATPase/putative transporter RbbA n=1 Tax=Kaistia sp. 32K TaxID=2795690 RepID=UPI0019153E86|nr:ribosome-associated ATPase/putative transporter RbbA [Kaistia sp. 32K]BCP51775.1 multidrug ABC transporter ATP-binding protein [Kaistia sp. 32K]